MPLGSKCAGAPIPSQQLLNQRAHSLLLCIDWHPCSLSVLPLPFPRQDFVVCRSGFNLHSHSVGGGGGLEVSRGANESEEPIGCF